MTRRSNEFEVRSSTHRTPNSGKLPPIHDADGFADFDALHAARLDKHDAAGEAKAAFQRVHEPTVQLAHGGMIGVERPARDAVEGGRHLRHHLHRVERAIPVEDAAEYAMDHYYIDYVNHAPDSIATALRTIADPRSGAVLVHCAAGKDRTGVVVAVALSLVGVTRDAVTADYTRSGERIGAIRDRLLATDLYAEDMAKRTLGSMTPHADNMERFLDRVDAEYGGVHGLAMSVGVDEETLARLSRRLLH